MQQYTGFFIILTLIFIIVVTNKYLFWWVKSLIIAYYVAVAYFFITVKDKIDLEYEGVRPVPEAYWDENSGWVDTIASYLFFPLIAILLFIYVKWFIKTRSKKAKVFIVLSAIIAAFLLLFFAFLFSFGYGYRP